MDFLRDNTSPEPNLNIPCGNNCYTTPDLRYQSVYNVIGSVYPTPPSDEEGSNGATLQCHLNITPNVISEKKISNPPYLLTFIKISHTYTIRIRLRSY